MNWMQPWLLTPPFDPPPILQELAQLQSNKLMNSVIFTIGDSYHNIFNSKFKTKPNQLAKLAHTQHILKSRYALFWCKKNIMQAHQLKANQKESFSPNVS